MFETRGNECVKAPKNYDAFPLYRPDEFLQMPDYTASLFYKQNPTMMVDLVHYQSVKEWCDYAKTNPSITMDDVPVLYSLND